VLRGAKLDYRRWPGQFCPHA